MDLQFVILCNFSFVVCASFAGGVVYSVPWSFSSNSSKLKRSTSSLVLLHKRRKSPGGVVGGVGQFCALAFTRTTTVSDSNLLLRKHR